MRVFATALFILVGSALASNAQSKQFTINFQGVVGDRVFDCRDTYEGIGTTGSKMTVSDFRFYVQDFRLIDKKGKETPLSLIKDGQFQTDKVALLDFENGLGSCTNGTKETNYSIRDTAPKGRYVGLKFLIGVPEELNHLDPTLQPSPLNLARMMWSWQMGYKFVRIDIKTTGRPNGYVLHLGSTECKGEKGQSIVCGKANRPEFAFPKFDLRKETVIFDLKALFAGTNVDFNQEKTAAGCMSFKGDSDCAPLFKNLGLPFDGRPASVQSVIRTGTAIEARAKTEE
jgi:uncharacterized repeat protein (TIGR04052 family)